MNNNILIAVDAGKSSCKSVTKIQGKIERNQFRTKVQEVENLGIDIPPNNFKVEYQGKTYLVGEAVGEERIRYDISKKSIEHLIFIYLSIANFVEITGQTNISLAVGTPLNIYKNKLLKEEYEQYIQGEEKVEKILNKLIAERGITTTNILTNSLETPPLGTIDILKNEDKDLIDSLF